MAAEVLPVSVAIPTIGRLGPLRQCLQSLAGCRPRADEVLVVDQSHDPAVAELVAEFASARARLVRCVGKGPASGRNTGLREAQHDIIAMTDDDCTVAADWVAIAWQMMQSDPEKVVTGRVLPVGDPRAVPSTKEDTTPQDFTGDVRMDALYSGNMVLNRALALAEGGFDERFGPDEVAEDNDFCYRWLKAGRRLYFEPALVVWHHDSKSPSELDRQYVRYMRGQGFLYAKHLREGDLRMLGNIGRDLLWSARGLAAGVVKRTPRWTDPRRAILRGLPAGLLRGWRVYWRDKRPDAPRSAPE
jgi:GT2 family glycosyltransferase